MGVAPSKLSLPHGAEILRSGAYADLELRCEGKTWMVHKNVLCPQSEWFKAAGDGRFRETEERVITLHDDSPEAVEAMLSFLYTKDYSDEASLLQKTTLSSRPATFNVRVFALGEKYLIPSLRDLAAQKFQTRIRQVNGNDLLEATAEAYATTSDISRQLRDIIATSLVDNVDKLFSDSAGKQAFCKIAEAQPAFSADIGEIIHKRARALKRLERKTIACPGCSKFCDEVYRANSGTRVICVCRACGMTANYDSYRWTDSIPHVLNGLWRFTFWSGVTAGVVWVSWKVFF